MSKKDKAPELVTRKYQKRSMFGEVLHSLKKNKGAMVGLIIIGVLVLVMILSFIFIDYDMITRGNPRIRLSPPSAEHPFGTDGNGRDAFLRVIYGTRYSLAIGFFSSLIAAVFGIMLGAIAGYYGKTAENIIMRFAEIISSVPAVLLGMVIVAVIGNSLRNLIIAVGVTSIPVYIRITRATILTIKDQEYVEAGRAIGLRDFSIIFKHVLPNGLSPIIVTYTINFGIMVISAASLSFMGFGVPIPLPEWGAMIAAGRETARTASFLMTYPGLFIMVTVLAFNLLGDGLRDALDPKLKGKR